MSQCAQCRHKFGFDDQVPLVSFFLSGGRCRYCGCGLSWLPSVIEVVTAVMFVVFARKWGLNAQLSGMLIFGCTLIAASVTDIKTRLIPHDITYPSMLAGILFSTAVRNDLFGALAGIGASYVVFDFLAHYGLKLYLSYYVRRAHTPSPSGSENGSSNQESVSSIEQHIQELPHDIQVVGGADAVLAAVIAAWLGWQKLLIAFAVSLVAGTLTGIFVLLREIYFLGKLKKCIQIVLITTVVGFIVLSLPIAAVHSFKPDAIEFATLAGIMGAVLGLVFGIIATGPSVPKPFPFGPSLAVGGFVAMFY